MELRRTTATTTSRRDRSLGRSRTALLRTHSMRVHRRAGLCHHPTSRMGRCYKAITTPLQLRVADIRTSTHSSSSIKITVINHINSIYLVYLFIQSILHRRCRILPILHRASRGISPTTATSTTLTTTTTTCRPTIEIWLSMVSSRLRRHSRIGRSTLGPATVATAVPVTRMATQRSWDTRMSRPRRTAI